MERNVLLPILVSGRVGIRRDFIRRKRTMEQHTSMENSSVVAALG